MNFFITLEPPEYQIIRLRLSGNLSLEVRQQLVSMLSPWEARFGSLEIDDKELILTPSAEDLQYFASSGFLGSSLARLLTIRQDNQYENQQYANRAIQLLWHQLHVTKELS